MSIAVARRPPTIALRKAIGDRGLPGAKIDLLLRLPCLLDRGFQLSIKVPAGNFVAHGPKKSKVARMSLREFTCRDIAFRMIDPKWGKPDRAVSDSIEEELSKIVAPSCFRNPESVIGPSIGLQHITVKPRVAVVDVWTNHVYGRS